MKKRMYEENATSNRTIRANDSIEDMLNETERLYP